MAGDLAGDFDTIIECPQVDELIRLEHLVQPIYYAPTTPDLKGVHSRAGDYVESELAQRMDRPQLIGDIVGHWLTYGERRKTVAFAVNVEHSIHLRDEFVRHGVKAEHIDGSTPKADRDAVLKRLEIGELEIVTNCMVLTEGWDMPEVGCCILARPTKQLGLYRQMVGRVLRTATGKTNAIVLDHSGAVHRLGLVEDRVEWMLAEDRKAEVPAQLKRERRGDENSAPALNAAQSDSEDWPVRLAASCRSGRAQQWRWLTAISALSHQTEGRRERLQPRRSALFLR